jgi:hypothetical protein
LVQYTQIRKTNTPHNRLKDKNHTIVLTDVEKAFDEIQHLLTIKNAEQIKYTRNILKHDKGQIQ